MQDWRTARHDQQGLLLRSESSRFDGDRILAERDCVEVELSIGASLRRHGIVRIASLKRGVGPSDGVVLRVMDNPAHIAEHGRCGWRDCHCEQRADEHDERGRPRNPGTVLQIGSPRSSCGEAESVGGSSAHDVHR